MCRYTKSYKIKTIEDYIEQAEDIILFRLHGGGEQPLNYYVFEQYFDDFYNLHIYYTKLQDNSFDNSDEEEELWIKSLLEVAGRLV